MNRKFFSPCLATCSNTTARAMALAVPAFALLLSGCERESSSTGEQITIPIEVARPLERTDVVPYEYARGTTTAVHSVNLYCHVSGFLKKVGFEDGDSVKKDDKANPLFVIDDAPFKASYDMTVAQKDVAIAHAKKTAADLARNLSLQKSNPGAISQADIDATIAAKDEADATVVAAEAAVKKAKVDLDYTRIYAEYDGRARSAKDPNGSPISPGDLVVADSTLLGTLITEDEMYVEFNVDERTVLDIQEKIRTGQIKLGEKKTVAIKLENDSDYVHEGEIIFIDITINSNTGTNLIRAKFPNPQPPDNGPRLLKPGMNIDVRIPIGMPGPALLVADAAIGSDLDRKYVYVLNGEGRPEKRMVELGQMHDGLRVVTKGLSASEQVIVEGGPQAATRPKATLKKIEKKMTDYLPASASPVTQPEAKPPAAAKPQTPRGAAETTAAPAAQRK